MNKGSSSYANLYKKKHETVKCRQEIPCQEKSIVSNEKKVNFDQLKDWDEFPNSNPKVVINEIDDNDNKLYTFILYTCWLKASSPTQFPQ